MKWKRLFKLLIERIGSAKQGRGLPLKRQTKIAFQLFTLTFHRK